MLDRSLSESFEARLHAEKAHEENDYQSRLTLVHVTEIEEALEDG